MTKTCTNKKPKPYCIEYRHNGKAFAARIIAASFVDAVHHVKSIRESAKVSGELVGQA